MEIFLFLTVTYRYSAFFFYLRTCRGSEIFWDFFGSPWNPGGVFGGGPWRTLADLGDPWISGEIFLPGVFFISIFTVIAYDLGTFYIRPIHNGNADRGINQGTQLDCSYARIIQR